ncbi:mucin-2-like isoform X2 [Hemiscyllium ocellatum]|uniref:mucin-2-like isoform X2 n=1 Tax=Hemiscyllium ocellatum TaxID=170820 RepID=UPI002966AE36|nr:mucin-2-like isoform X2 [Hemiscyllium ocellatum]
MEKLVLVVLWGLSLCKGLDSLSAKHVPVSLEETILARNRGFCSTWGNGAFRTFDDQFYHFTSTCNYILSRHCANGAEDFNIQIRRGSDGKLEHVFIKIEGVKILLVNGSISVQDAVVRLPYHDKVIGIYKTGIYTQLSDRKHTISVNWNNQDAFWLTIDDKYQGQLCGLCGNFDKNRSSNYDLSFLNANKLDVLGHTCYSNPHSSQSCEDNSCGAISKLFLSCFNTDIIGQYWKLCRADVCSCKGPGCQCATFAEIARHCDKATLTYWEKWRTETPCTFPTCPGDQIYKECGPSSSPTCTDPNPQQRSNVCVNTCICPEGKVLDNVRGTNRCITESVCPCEYSGQIYQVGEIRNTSCQSCVCESGKWTCSYRHCPGRCTIEEATYFTTFDNTFYNLFGDCSYYAVLTNDWNVKVTIHQCQAAFKQACLQRVTLTKNQTNIVINNDGSMYLDGNKVASPLKTGEIIIFWQSSKFIQVATTFGLKMQVQIDPVMQLYISLSDDVKGSTKGLCGTFNDDADDDFFSAQGIVESTPITFANSWETEDSCPEATIPSPCVSSENELYAKLHCSHLKDPAGVFSVCHSTVDYMKYYRMCVAATCACENINDCLCAGLGAYVHECAVHGLIIRNWRKDICDKPCPNTQVFENDMRACNRTCRSLSHYDYTCDVKDTPVYGCGCPEGKYMDNSGECIDKADCSCYMGEIVIKKGQSMTLNGRICTCENGKVSCPLIPTTTQPGCLNGKVYNDCTKIIVPGKSNAKTCRSRNIPPSNSLCVPGCVCPGNLVEDDSGRCIDPEQCPCLFGGESHKAGTTIKRDCNKCTCRAGVWDCTTNSCPKTCHVHGDGQYLTFDGKRYRFDGNCEYIFVEDYCNQGSGTFQILTESVPCCENGVTCSRNIKILLVGKEFILTDGRIIQSDKSRETKCIDSSYSLHTVGLYLILKFSNGITVIWDKRTKLSITLDPRWKNKVCGLCGNFNDDVADDLTTKGNSLVTDAVRFGSSWKSSLSCSDAMNQTFPCDRNPYCLAWAQRKCSIIKDAAFQKCHKKVDPTPFYDACVQEACACDLEGKYLGFCTAVAVYAEACNKAGVCVYWRTPDLCPVYCDYYNSPRECSWHYQPCGTLTTKTCSDHHIGKKFSAILEGCYAKCPENAPYLDENKMKCVNLTECTCYYNGIILHPDETTSNDCEECECKNGKVTCRASSTTTVKPTLPLTTTNRFEETTTRIIRETTSTETTQLPVIPSTTKSTTSYILETTPPSERPTTMTSTTGYIPETTTPSETPTTRTSTTSYIPEEECNGEWSSWINDNIPSDINPEDVELLDLTHDELCPSLSDTINKIQCQFVDFPEWPVSQSIDNVTCDIDTGLVCTFNESGLGERKSCYDYQIRVCCEPQVTTESTTTSLPETTSTTIIPETTTPSERPTTRTSTTSYIPETTLPVRTTTESTTIYIPETTTPSERPTTRTSTTSYIPETTLPVRTTTESTTIYIPEEECNGEWSSWINDNIPSDINPEDVELLDLTHDELCPSLSDTINKIQCQFVDFPEWPVSQSIDNVTCDIDTGLVCTFNESGLGERKSCYDYQIRVCCEPQVTTESTTTSLPETTSTTIIPETTTPSERPTTRTSTTSYIPETTLPVRTTTESTTIYIPETTTPSERPTTRTSTTSYIPETTLPVRTATESTTIYIPEEECNGEWSSWINDNVPSDINPEDVELLDSRHDELCPSLSDTINKIQCQFVDFPEWPVSQSIDNVTCDIDTGLVCTFNESGLGERKSCYDYQIRVCCEPQVTTESTTTSLPETTSTTIIPETTTPSERPTTRTSTTSYIPETTLPVRTTTESTTIYIPETTTPSERPTTRTSTTSYIPETTLPIRTTTESTTIYIPETTPLITTTTSTTSPTSSVPETIPPIQTTTTTPTTSSVPGESPTTRTSTIGTTTTEPYCNGIWSPWFNKNTPSIQNKGDSELLETIRYKLCPFSPYRINDIACEAVKFPQRPISETKDNVSCDINKGLICNYNEQTPENHLMCLDYRIRVCCEPILTSQITSTAIVPIIHSTVYEPPITHVTEKPLESCQCNSNPPRKCLETWKDNCTMITCIRGNVFKMDGITCPTLIKPKCINNIEPVKVRTADGCCEKWECDCECEIWGDPHYSTFDGTVYDFFENCTYTLVEERVPKYNFSVLLDNYFCFPFVKKSCPRGLIISYNGNVVHISTGRTYVLTVNENDVSPPYNANDFIITKLGISTYISIPGIRTTIIAYPNAFKIRVPEQYFLDNTQGQCGSCSHSPPKCIRKNGKAEPNDCCHRTAFDWKVQDSKKPYCQSAPTNVPCTPIPPPPTCKPERTICDLIQSQPFKQCREKINLDRYLKTCIFDHCVTNSTMDCTSLETAALACASVGVCVDWRPFTNGMCNYLCNQGFVYKPCQNKEDDQCKNATLIAGEALTPTEEGCFCPDGMLLSEDKSRCVAFCQNCRDQFGQPRKEGDVWEDANNPCISYKCTEFGILTRNMSCNQDESCPESDRVYLDRCCFACQLTKGECKINKFNETIISGQCEATFEATECLGHCSSATRYDPKRHQMDSDCQCCHEDKTESMLVDLQCKNGKTKTVEYTSIKSCKCKDCGNTFQNMIKKDQNPKPKPKKLKPKPKKSKPKPKKSKPKPQNPKSKPKNPKSKPKNPKSKPKNPKSKPKNPKSKPQEPKPKYQEPKP